MQDKISVIIPIYNVEKYLHRCVDSVLSQTYTNMEIILVNDGSPDNCPQICDDYALKDKRVQVIHQKNAGVSAARNAGLNLAQGEWVTFIDSDDWVDPYMYEKMLQAAIETKKTIVFCNFNFYFSETNQKKHMQSELPEIIEKNQSIAYALDPYYRFFCGGVCCVLFHRSLFGNENGSSIRFDSSIHVEEDVLVLTQTLNKADGVAYVFDALYYYFQREGSASKSMNEKKLTALTAGKRIIELVEPISSDLTQLAKVHFARISMSLLAGTCRTRQYEYVPILRHEARRYAHIYFLSNKITLKTKIIDLTALLLPRHIVGFLSRLNRRRSSFNAR